MRAALLTCLLCSVPLPAQQSQAPVSFEVATVRLAADASEPEHGYWSLPNIGRFEAHTVSLAVLAKLAYGLPSEQIVGLPPWASTTYYDVEAKPEPDVRLSREELQPRLRELLAERLGWRAHEEARERSVYALRVAKGGVHLPMSSDQAHLNFRSEVRPGQIEGLGWTMDFLAAQLTPFAGRVVTNATGLTERYDVRLQYAASPEVTDKPDLFTAVQQQLGLRLESERAPVRVIVVDHVERTPAEN